MFSSIFEEKVMSPTDFELHTALMALRAIAFQAEQHLNFLSGVAAPEDFFKNKLKGQNRKVGTTKKSDEAVLL
jgi:hypothetical protein